MTKRHCFNLVAPILSLFLVLLLLLAPLAASVPIAHAQTTFQVDSPNDAHDANPGDGFCDNGVDGCNLRAAIEEAASASPPVTINIGSGLSGSTFYLDGNLGTIIWTANDTTLDGGASGITIDASGLVDGSALQIGGSGNTIQNLVIHGASRSAIEVGDLARVGQGNSNTIQHVKLFSNGYTGVYVLGSDNGGSQNNMIGDSIIGTDSITATTCMAGHAQSGVLIGANAVGTQVFNSYIVCSEGDGVYLYGTYGAITNTAIWGNYIGTNGTDPLPNSSFGILDDHGVGTTIEDNVISGNGAAGIALGSSQNTIIRSNYIGLDGSANGAIPNSGGGVVLQYDTQNVTVGGTTLHDRNYISGNTACGVHFLYGPTANTLNGNVIGLNATGDAVPNGTCGVAVISANGNTIGSDGNPISQTISGNAQQGIRVEGSSSTWIGSSNLVGLALDGTTARGNGLEGILLITATNTTVKAAKVMNNGGAGIALTGNGTGNLLLPGRVSNNGGLGIDLGNDGFTANGSQTPPGPNNWIQYPVITSANGSLIAGTACASCMVSIYQAVGNPTANGGGGTYVGAAAADASGAWSYILGGGLTPSQVTLLANDSITFDTSEMSPLSSTPASYSVFLPVVIKHFAP